MSQAENCLEYDKKYTYTNQTIILKSTDQYSL